MDDAYHRVKEGIVESLGKCSVQPLAEDLVLIPPAFREAVATYLPEWRTVLLHEYLRLVAYPKIGEVPWCWEEPRCHYDILCPCTGTARRVISALLEDDFYRMAMKNGVRDVCSRVRPLAGGGRQPYLHLMYYTTRMVKYGDDLRSFAYAVEKEIPWTVDVLCGIVNCGGASFIYRVMRRKWKKRHGWQLPSRTTTPVEEVD